MKTWVIPDVHGYIQTLRSLVENQIIPTKDDILVFLGDLIDRGPDSKGVIDYVKNLRQQGFEVIVLKGNHELYLENSYHAEKSKSFLKKTFKTKTKILSDWLQHGGKDTIKSFDVKNVENIPFEYVDWVSKLDFYYETENFYIVHAGFNFNQDDIFSDTHSMMWIRDFKVDKKKLNGKRVIHGHVPVQLDFIIQCIEDKSYDFIDLDNGVYRTNTPGYGNLLALEVNSMQLLIQANVD